MLKKIVLAGVLAMASFISFGARTGDATAAPAPTQQMGAGGVGGCPGGQICDYWHCYPC